MGWIQRCARKAAEKLIEGSDINNTKVHADQRNRSESEGQRRMNELANQESLWITDTLWMGVNTVRAGAGATLVGTPQMIANARGRGGSEEYILGNIDEYEPAQGFDLIHSMEVLYYLEDPASILKKIASSWLNEAGRLIVGIDLYYENSDSHSWEEKVGTRMLMFKETEWINFFKQAGFNDVRSWRANQSKDWAGTLVLTGKK